jgi:ankyrin repeat protein
VPAPAPGSVKHERRIAPPAPKRKLTDAQFAKALVQVAESGESAKLRELLTDARAKKRLLDAALLAVARTGTRSGAEGAVDLDCLRALLAKGANPNAKHDGTSVLGYGIHQGLPFVRAMLAAGADPNGAGILKEESILHRAVEFGDRATVSALLDAGADPNGGERTPLQCAARGSLEAAIGPEMIDLLVARGAKVDPPKQWRTALLWAVAEGRTAMVERLIAHGANVNALDGGKQKQRALHIAFERGNDTLAKLLVEHGADRTLRDATGLDMTTVYDARGDRVQSESDVDIAYTPSAELQRVEVTARVCVMTPLLRNMQQVDVEAAWWARLVLHGVAGSDRFAPESGWASVIEPFDFRTIKKRGTFERKCVLEVAGVAPELFRMMAARLTATSMTFTGAGMIADARIVSVKVRGSLADNPTTHPASTSARFAAYPEALPFTLRAPRGEKSSVFVRAKRAWKVETLPLVSDYVCAWLDTQSTWRRRDIWRGEGYPRYGKLGLDSPLIEIHQLRASGALGAAFPYELEDARAVLANAMRALHAKVPLAEVVFTWA